MMQGHHHLGGESSSPATLLIRHLPEAIPHSTMIALFAHYGASSVRPCDHGRMKNCAFVDFKNVILAVQAQKQLHGLRFLGKVLSVERATKGAGDAHNQEGEKQIRNTTQKSTSVSKDPSDKSWEGFNFQSEPIAEKLGVEYPFPPHLEYAYPPPDGNILTNIMNALIAVPRFYTQVLHLMNKMNIPAPFRKALPSPPLPEPIQPVPEYVSSGTTKVECPTSSESEMESSDEEIQGETRRKRAKRQAIVGPAVDHGVAHEAVGLKPATLVPKEKAIIRKKNPVLKINIAPKQTQSKEEHETAVEESREISPKEPSDHPYATAEELKRGRLPPEEILSLPRFKNYTAGDPSPVLYIKNLAKDVVVNDFYFIFGSFFESLDAAKANLGVKLMQEGRMRGQAFVTFPTVELARTALNEANGYVFKGKPVVIQFGRSSSSAK